MLAVMATNWYLLVIDLISFIDHIQVKMLFKILIIFQSEGSNYCSNAMEKFLKKDLVIIKEDNEDFENSTKCSFLIMLMLMVMLK